MDENLVIFTTTFMLLANYTLFAPIVQQIIQVHVGNK
jgi:hypothetical protein